jgi:hypothetical protein
MPDRIRRVLNDLVLLSQTLSGSERERILETIDRFRHCVEEDKVLVEFRGDGERAQATSASIKEPSSSGGIPPSRGPRLPCPGGGKWPGGVGDL